MALAPPGSRFYNALSAGGEQGSLSEQVLGVVAQVGEVVMLACFGCSWPVSVVKSLRVRKVTGKSPLFLWLILSGYLGGIAFKLARWRTDPGGRWILALYVFNLTFVAVDTFLYYRYRHND
jgi:hypothetical protein